jgi:hypothetical protein
MDAYPKGDQYTFLLDHMCYATINVSDPCPGDVKVLVEQVDIAVYVSD